MGISVEVNVMGSIGLGGICTGMNYLRKLGIFFSSCGIRNHWQQCAFEGGCNKYARLQLMQQKVLNRMPSRTECGPRLSLK